MNDKFQQTIQTLGNLKKQFDAAIPVALKKMTESPEMQRIVEISQTAQQTLPVALKRFAEMAAPYADLAKQFVANVAPYLVQLAQMSERLSVIDRLGKLQYVAWKGFPEAFYEKACATQTEQGLKNLVFDWLEDSGFVEVDETIRLLLENEHLRDNHVFLQTVDSYRRGEYDIASLGFTAMIDRLLSVYTGMINSPSIAKRVEAIKAKVDKDGEAALDDLDLNDYVLISTYSNALELFGARRDFTDAEPELNRHWIAHGRMERGMEQIDCIRLINILYGTILMGMLGAR